MLDLTVHLLMLVRQFDPSVELRLLFGLLRHLFDCYIFCVDIKERENTLLSVLLCRLAQNSCDTILIRVHAL